MRIALLSLIGAVFASAVSAASFNVKVETYVGGKLEDKFFFVVEEGTPQVKGFDGKYLAKRFLAKGFLLSTYAEFNDIKAAREEMKQRESKTFQQRLVEELMHVRDLSATEERRQAAIGDAAELLKKRLAELEKIEALASSGSSAAAKAKFAEYEKSFMPSVQDILDKKRLARANKIKYRDYEEYDVGSYCRMEVLKVLNSHAVRFNISYAYSRLLSMQYHDGANTDNAITKYPVFETFEWLGTKAKITLGKPYCIQFTRPSSVEEAKSIKETLSQTALFSGGDLSLVQDEDNEPKLPERPKGRLDAKGSYDKIKAQYELEASQTLRAVFTVTAAR